MKIEQIKKLRQLGRTAMIMVGGLLLFKYLPMYINYLRFGTSDILYDASSHIVSICFALYALWIFLVEDTKRFRILYLMSSAIIILLMGFERLVAHQHNTFGLTMGLLIAIVAIIIPRRKEVFGK